MDLGPSPLATATAIAVTCYYWSWSANVSVRIPSYSFEVALRGYRLGKILLAPVFPGW
ncbi:hypothetical protein E8E14_000856 [Neopestalotiopsis sp. 37M]|nr:hypothetical protein E8E14_000856 [Neopestalotiopsis sp. 37M]